ncbi:hypothetical protein G5714_004451 [Onychostoma macrolepis]|uniref:Uncharacterized protein n=1 Tax=Onychostoma macrolepis TaxID=369639 RepID=A0A7J6D4R1_9TELE|nr:hypothetical protein G5714_004451 [Onychostoma macrolepis]
MKLMYDLIHLVHHLEKVTTRVVNNMPSTFRRLTQLLTSTVKPAVPSKRVEQLLEGNARNWSYTTQLILEEHYNTLVEQTIAEFQERTHQADWFHAFQTASSCARRNFRNRIDSDMFERVEVLFAAEMCDETENSRGKEATSTQCTANTRPSNTYKPPQEGTKIQWKVPGPPPSKQRGLVFFTRKFHRWFEPPPAIQPTPTTPYRLVKPLPQRKPRRIFTEMLVDTSVPPTTNVKSRAEEQSQSVDRAEATTLYKTINLMEKVTVALEPEVLIFSFGINKSKRCINTTTKEI